MAEEIRRVERFGPDDGLQFELALDPAPPIGAAGLAWGDGLLRFAGEALWSGEDTQGAEVPLRWTWIDLLEHLARYWPSLILEETYPIPVSPLFPGSLRREAEQRWEKDDLSEACVDREDEAVYRFLCRHDLAMALKGLFVPSFLLVRQGRQFMLSCPFLKLDCPRPEGELIDTLNRLGDALAAAVAESREPRAVLAHELWRSRDERLSELIVPIRSGLEPEGIERIARGAAADAFWELDPEQPAEDTELLAAARMSAGHIDIDTQRALLERIRRTPAMKTPALDALSAGALAAHEETGRPYEKGYRLAAWLRTALGLDPLQPADPADLLDRWGVAVEAFDLSDSTLEAIAAWGPRHGPLILHRAPTDGSPGEGKPFTHTRIRSTLAHEICHLLIDRERALPVAEVLGGRSPEYAEKRARAFAAELLLPREAAACTLSHAASLEDALAQLRQRFGVSRELAAWQISNSAAYATLGPEERSRLDAIRRAGD